MVKLLSLDAAALADPIGLRLRLGANGRGGLLGGSRRPIGYRLGLDARHGEEPLHFGLEALAGGFGSLCEPEPFSNPSCAIAQRAPDRPPEKPPQAIEKEPGLDAGDPD